MILHTHTVPVAEDEGHNHTVEVWVLHASPVEVKFLGDALDKALTDSPDSESYSISLGRVDQLTPTLAVAEEPVSPE